MAKVKKTVASSPISVNLGIIDWSLLQRQKTQLLALQDRMGDIGEKEKAEALEGIVSLLDHIQDEAAKQLGSKEVFG